MTDDISKRLERTADYYESQQTNKDYDNGPGHWITTDEGNHVFIEDGSYGRGYTCSDKVLRGGADRILKRSKKQRAEDVAELTKLTDKELVKRLELNDVQKKEAYKKYVSNPNESGKWERIGAALDAERLDLIEARSFKEKPASGKLYKTGPNPKSKDGLYSAGNGVRVSIPKD